MADLLTLEQIAEIERHQRELSHVSWPHDEECIRTYCADEDECDGKDCDCEGAPCVCFRGDLMLILDAAPALLAAAKIVATYHVEHGCECGTYSGAGCDCGLDTLLSALGKESGK